MSATNLLVVVAPIHVISEANIRCHWRVKAKRVAAHRSLARVFLNGHHKPDAPCAITLTRIAPRELDDDNLAAGCKGARDGVADWLGIDDGDKRLSWAYAQRRGGKGEYALEVRIAWAIA
jgi:predicted Fe-S protein YdhL (DUF1289 family)